MKETVSKILENTIERNPKLSGLKNDITLAFEAIAQTYKNGGTLFVCGNGGSCSDSEHIVGELMKSFMYERKPSDEFVAKLRDVFGEDTEIARVQQEPLPLRLHEAGEARLPQQVFVDEGVVVTENR